MPIKTCKIDKRFLWCKTPDRFEKLFCKARERHTIDFVVEDLVVQDLSPPLRMDEDAVLVGVVDVVPQDGRLGTLQHSSHGGET